MTFTVRSALFTASAIASTTPGFAAGPLGEYYLTQPGLSGEGHVYVVQGSSVVRSWTSQGSQYESAIAVFGDVRTTAIEPGSMGAKYTLAGTDTGVRYTLPSGLLRCYDGTTDGTFNYTIDHTTGGLYRFDRDWANGQLLFDLADLSYAGITYDFTDNTLWIARYWGNTIEHRSVTGGLLGTFIADHPYIHSLALDPTDNTLWFTGGLDLGHFYQYSKGGQELQRLTISGMANFTYGGEFAPVPEPSTIAILGLAACGLARRRRSRTSPGPGSTRETT